MVLLSLDEARRGYRSTAVPSHPVWEGGDQQGWSREGLHFRNYQLRSAANLQTQNPELEGQRALQAPPMSAWPKPWNQSDINPKLKWNDLFWETKGSGRNDTIRPWWSIIWSQKAGLYPILLWPQYTSHKAYKCFSTYPLPKPSRRPALWQWWLKRVSKVLPGFPCFVSSLFSPSTSWTPGSSYHIGPPLRVLVPFGGAGHPWGPPDPQGHQIFPALHSKHLQYRQMLI